MKPLVITGLGVVSNVAIGRSAFFSALASPTLLADAPTYPVESFDGARYPDAQLAEVRGFEPSKYLGEKGLRTLDRLTKLLVVATRLGLADAGLKKDNAFVGVAPERVGLCLSNAYGSLEAVAELDRVATLEDARYINPAKFPNTVSNSAAGYASIWEDLRALNVSVSDGNCGALDALALAELFIQTGRADAIMVGGVEAMSEPLYLAFRKLGATSTAARLGEGAALFALEPEDGARARGATTHGAVIGYGTAFVPPEGEASLVHASDEALGRAIRSALADAAVDPSDIDVVASGMSGMRPFDRAELLAIDQTLGENACVAAPKSVVGETLGAGGSLAMASALAWFAGIRPCPVVRGQAKDRVRTVLVTSLGYYGNASAAVMCSDLDLGA